MQNLYKKHKHSVDAGAKKKLGDREAELRLDEVKELLFKEYKIDSRDFYHMPSLPHRLLVEAICRRMVEESDAEML